VTTSNETTKLVVCFSLTGNTRLVAKTMAKEINADYAEIVPLKQYPLRGAYLYIKGGKEAVFKSEPALEEGTVRYEDYDLIIVGTPVWAGTMAPPLRTFLKSPALRGKKLFLFCTHGSGPGSCLRDMREIAQGEVVGDCDFHMGRKAAAESIGQAKILGNKLRER